MSSCLNISYWFKKKFLDKLACHYIIYKLLLLLLLFCNTARSMIKTHKLILSLVGRRRIFGLSPTSLFPLPSTSLSYTLLTLLLRLFSVTYFLVFSFLFFGIFYALFSYFIYFSFCFFLQLLSNENCKD